MKETVTIYRFRDAFKQSDTYKNNFSYEGLTALFEHLEELEWEMDGMEFELDVVAFCCDYTEYDSLEDFNADYTGKPGNDYLKYKTFDEIREETVVIEIPDTERFIIGDF